MCADRCDLANEFIKFLYPPRGTYICVLLNAEYSFKISLRIMPLSFFLQQKSNPCRFGVRIVLLQPPACRKRRLKGWVRGSLVATSAAARCQGSRFYPGQGRNLDRVFCSMRTAVPPPEPQHRVPEPVPSLENHL